MIQKLIILAIAIVRSTGQESDFEYGDDIFDMKKHTTPTPTQTPIRTAPNPAPRENAFEKCGNGGECVPYYLCKDEKIITDGQSIFTPRVGGFGLDGAADLPECKNFQLKCCGVDDITNDPIDLPGREYKKGCGHRNANGVGGIKITGAKEGEANFGEFPWMVMIMLKSDGMNKCGGSLIHPSVVLTAAHCVDGKAANELRIRAGEWDSSSKYEVYAHEDRDVHKIKIHNTYESGPLYNDVALVFLAGKPLELRPNINTICLPPQEYVFDNNFNCFVSGWGKNAYGSDQKYQKIMKKIELPMVPHKNCQINLRKTRLRYRFVLHRSFVCAGGEEGKDACNGDGGGPLVCPINVGANDRYYQAGLVAWGVDCGLKDVPGVYGKVSRFRNWIDQQFETEHLDKSFYTA